MRFGAKEGGVGIPKPNFHTLSNVLLNRPGPSKPSVFAYGEAISLRHKGGAFLFKLTANKVETFLRLVGSGFGYARLNGTGRLSHRVRSEQLQLAVQGSRFKVFKVSMPI